MDGGIPIDEMLVMFLGKDCAGIVDAWIMVLLPDIGNAVGWFPLDHGHLHDFPEFARTGIGEGHLVCEF